MPTTAPIREVTYSIQDAAQAIGVAIPTIRKWIFERRIGCFKVGRVRIPESEIFRLKRDGWRPPEPV